MLDKVEKPTGNKSTGIILPGPTLDLLCPPPIDNVVRSREQHIKGLPPDYHPTFRPAKRQVHEENWKRHQSTTQPGGSNRWIEFDKNKNNCVSYL